MLLFVCSSCTSKPLAVVGGHERSLKLTTTREPPPEPTQGARETRGGGDKGGGQELGWRCRIDAFTSDSCLMCDGGGGGMKVGGGQGWMTDLSDPFFMSERTRRT